MGLEINFKDINGHDDITFLREFIEKEAAGFQKPQRAGLKKGSRIGMSIEKQLAGLFIAVTNLSQKRISGLLKVSYGSMRTWTSEPEYQAYIEQMADKFATFIRQCFLAGDIGYKGEKNKDFNVYSRRVKELLSTKGTVGCMNLSIPALIASGEVATSEEIMLEEIRGFREFLCLECESLSARDKSKIGQFFEGFFLRWSHL